MNNTPKLDRKSYEEYFKGFYLIDCVVRKVDLMYFLLEQEYDAETNTPPKNKVLTRLIEYDTLDPKVSPWGYQDLKGMQRLKAGVSYVPKEQFVGVSLNDHVYVLGSGDDRLEKDLVGGRVATGKDIGMRGGVSKLRAIDGHLWLAGSARTIGKRLGQDKWEWQDAIPRNPKNEGFKDIDGFSETDIYAAGGQGDLWHYDGKKWKQVPFPSNMDLWSICCAGDGYVYLGAESGSVFKGRNNEWQLIHRDGMALPFHDMVWFQDKVWCTSDYGVWTIENDKLAEAEIPRKVRACSGHLSVGDGVMLLAGIYGAALHDGKDWRMIIDFGDLD